MVWAVNSMVPRSVRGMRAGLACLALSLLLSACDEPRPRTFADFTEDRIAREGTLARCNANREATLNDIECANARRAQATFALARERERRETLEHESERRIAALTAEMAKRDRIAQEEASKAAMAANEAYEALWAQRQAQHADAGAGADFNVDTGADDNAGETEAPSAEPLPMSPLENLTSGE